MVDGFKGKMTIWKLVRVGRNETKIVNKERKVNV